MTNRQASHADDSGRPADEADWVQAAAESFERWRSASDMRALARAAAVLGGAQARMIVDPERAELAAQIAEALVDVSVRQSRPDVLDEAIRIVSRERSLLDAALDPRSDALLAGRSAGLLVERFFLFGRVADLAAAMVLFEDAADFFDAVPDAFADRERATFWWSFGMAHSHKADLAPQRAERVAAVQCLAKAAAAIGPESAFGRQIRGNHAFAQLELASLAPTGAAEHSDQRERLDDAIRSLQALADGARLAHERRQWHQNLCIALRERAESWPTPDDPRRRADLQRALAATEQGLDSGAANDRDRVYLLAARADCLRLLAGNGIDAAVEAAYREAIDASLRAGHVELLTVASNWQSLLGAAGRWDDAAAAGDSALAGLDAMVDSQPHQHYKQVFLRKAQGLAAATALACVRAGDAARAVTALERTLAVVWRQRYLGPRKLAGRLVAAGEPDLAARYLELIADARAVDARDDALQAAEARLAELRPRIDAALGATGAALGAASAADSRPAEPSLHLVTSAAGSVALLGDASGVKAIELPRVTSGEVVRVAARYRTQVVSADAPEDTAIAAADEIVCWLDDAVWRPIEAALNAAGAEHHVGLGDAAAPARADRIWTVVATGPFVGLPLHAAKLGDGQPVATLGIAYAPALSALAGPAPRVGEDTGVLIVADPTQPGQESLEGAIKERRVLSSIWPGAIVLEGPAATRSALRAALPAADLIHLACHGTSDERDPLRSAVVLADGEFTMRDVLSVRLRPGCLVVLSACQTAVGDESIPDEAMSLAAGFMAAGAAAVVASLWPIPDLPTAALMGEFHRALRAGAAPASALGAAQAAMAAGALADGADGDDWRSPYFWAGFVTLGAMAKSKDGRSDALPTARGVPGNHA